MATLAQLAKTVLRRGRIEAVERYEANSDTTTTWLVTAQDDIISTDVREGMMAMIQPKDIAELLNGAGRAIELIEELKNVTGSITAEQLADLFEEYEV
jgi:hypothetical protein